jgi:two-component system NtrC family sensor kinase
MPSVEPRGRQMRRQKLGGRAKKTSRPPNTPKIARRRSSVITLDETSAERLSREHTEALEQQAATNEVLRIIRRSPANAQPVFDAIVESASRLCGAVFSAVYLYDDDSFRIVATNNFSREATRQILELRQQRKPDRSHIAGRAILERVITHVPDVLADPEYSREWALAGGWRSVLAVPLLRDNKPLGVLSVSKAEPIPFSDRQIQLLKTFADQALIAIENVRLFEAERQRTNDLSEALEQQTATSEVLKVISNSPGELEPVFGAMLANATRICEAKFGTLFRFDGKAFHRAAGIGVPSALAEFQKKRGPYLPESGTLLDRVLQTRKVAHSPDYAAEPIPGNAAKLGGARSTVAVPMLKDSELVGAIIIYRQEVKPFTDKQIELVKNFAAQAVIAIENTRLLNELHQRTDDLSESLEQQTATSEVLQVISRSPGELAPVFKAMLENATRICQASYGVLFLREGTGFRTAATHNVPAAFADERQRNALIEPIPIDPLARLTETKQRVHIYDARTEAAYRKRFAPFVAAVELGGVRTLLLTPLLREGELIGAFAIFRQEVRPFTGKQIGLADNFAAQAVIAIENARLLNELRESLQQQTATADVLKVISRSTFDLQTVLQTLVESAARLCDADKATITRQKDGAFYSAETYGFSPGYMDYIRNIPIVPERGLASGRALLEGRLVHIPDVKADPEYTLLEGQRLGDYRTILAVPMLREGTPIGVLILTRSEVRPFTDKQIELVSTFADQAAIAIENVRLFESVEARTRELAASLENLRTTQDRLVQTQKLASLGQLTAGIAHEIKNPLNFVNNFSTVSSELIDELQDILKSPLDEKVRAQVNELAETLRGNLDKIVQHGKRADAIVKNMLLHSREGSGEHRRVDINALVEESLNLAYHGARAEKQGFNITLERSFDPAAEQADVFPQDITRVLLNLILNGFYAATKRKAEAGDGYEPTLLASTRSLGDRVEIRVRDNGTGIPSEVKDKMFNPFFTTKPAGEGTGLGLSISHDIIVKQHGGSIEVETELGEYTEFRIILPRAAAFVTTSGAQS